MKCYSKNLLFGFRFLVVSTVFVVTLCLQSVRSQEPITADKPAAKGATKKPLCKASHSTKDFYKSARMLEPATVLEILGNRVNYATSSEGIELGSLELERGYSVVPKDFTAKNHSGCFGIVYCEKHLVILHIVVLESKLCHLTKS